MLVITNSLRRKRGSLDTGRDGMNADSGFSLIELMIVITMIGILTGIAIIAFSASKNAYAADDQANAVVNYFRDASSRAIADHHSYRVVINLNTKTITEINENSIATGNTDTDTLTGDDTLVKQEPLRQDVAIGLPTGMITVPPGNYPAATFTGNVWCGHFQSNGSVTSSMGTLFTTSPALVTCSFVFQSTISNNNNQKTLIRAVTLAGATSTVRFWLYNGTAFIEG
ncbi:MAG: pilus assembly FimT family protein [Blastocatellia bacterium]